MAGAARAVSTAARGQPAREPESSRPDDVGAPRPRLDVVSRRRAESRSSHRRANLLRGLGVLFIVGALAVTAAGHALVASDQQRIDTLQGQLTQTLAEQQDLQLSRAELESPVRVLSIAERQLGMVSPESVSYLSPVNPGPTVAQVGAATAGAATPAAAKAASNSAVAAGKAGQAGQAGQAKSAKSAKFAKFAESDELAVGTSTRSSHAGAGSHAIASPTG